MVQGDDILKKYFGTNDYKFYADRSSYLIMNVWKWPNFVHIL